ncbi:MAG: leucyl aminopeptidase [Cyanophyceae cyanobacterium]
MQIQATDTSLSSWAGEALAIGLFEETKLEDIEQLKNLQETIAALIDEEEFDGKLGSTVATRLSSSHSVRKLILVGMEAEPPDLRTVGAAIARAAKQEKVKSLGVYLPVTHQDPATTAQMIAEGMLLAMHQDHRFKSEETPEKRLETVELIGLGHQDETLNRAQQICSGVILARELVNAPANVVNPVSLAQTAEQIAADHDLQLEILEREECERLGMGAFLGVALASDLPPKFIHLTYKPEGTPKRKLAIVGKGLTFDSGGLNIKGSGSGIETMKMDMGGSAATLGAAKAIAQLKPDVEVHFISAATENMISGHAMHPGDILTASNGKTIEVNNTDAEGRLTLADALVFAEKLGVDAIIDLATLTGACVVALGEDISGLWSTDEALADQIKQAAELAGEKFWQMPMEEKYFEGLKSPIADMKNTGPRAGGSITATLFLKQFVQNTPWAHLDIAGPVWSKKEAGVNNEGATGFPVRTLVHWVLNQ